MKIHASLLPATAAFLRRARRRVPGLLALALLPCVGAPAARAVTLAPKIFVASTGNDANTGAQNSPKRTFAAALGAVQAGGDIVALDTTNYGVAVITQAVTITAAAGATAFITVAGNSTALTIRAGATDVVNLSNLVIECGGPSLGIAVYAMSVGTLRVENCKISNTQAAILMQCGNNNAHLLATGVVIHDVFGGILVESTTAGSTITGTLSGCVVDGSTQGTGIAASPYNPNGSTPGLSVVTATHCVVSHCYDGFSATAGGTIVVDDCTVCECNTGVNEGGGAEISRGTNTFTDNVTDGNFTSTLAAK